MTPVFSGGLVYEWSQETSDYGLVDLSSGNITVLQDYNNLKAEFAATAMPTGDGGYNANGSASTCPENSTDFTSWAVLPAMPAAAQVYINNGAGQALGYKGPTNQDAGSGVTTPYFVFHTDDRLLRQSLRARILLRVRHVQVVLQQQVLLEVVILRVVDICCWLQKRELLVVLF
jgi:hypothetical protein